MQVQTAEVKPRPKVAITIPPRTTNASKISITLKAKQLEYVKRKVRENDSSVSQVIQAAIDVMEALDADKDKEIAQAI